MLDDTFKEDAPFVKEAFLKWTQKQKDHNMIELEKEGEIKFTYFDDKGSVKEAVFHEEHIKIEEMVIGGY